MAPIAGSGARHDTGSPPTTMLSSIPAPHADRLARAVLRDRLAVRPRENVTIEVYSSSLPWAAGFVREARRIGARPFVHYEDEGAYWDAVSRGRAAILGTPGEHEWAALEKTDVYVYFWGPENQARADTLSAGTWRTLTAFNAKWYDVGRRAGLRGARMSIARVTETNARFWSVSPSVWRREVFAASTRRLDGLRADARRLARVLSGSGRLRLRHSNGTDLTLALAGRAPRRGLGEVTPSSRRERFGWMTSVPDANVYVTVDETTAEGRVVSNRTNAAYGAPARGGRFEFENGRLTSGGFPVGGQSFASAFRSADAGRVRPAFVEVGLDPAIRHAPMLEESERGAVTVGLGNNAFIGGRTQSDFSAYLTVGGADLELDGRPIVRRGRLV